MTCRFSRNHASLASRPDSIRAVPSSGAGVASSHVDAVATAPAELKPGMPSPFSSEAEMLAVPLFLRSLHTGPIDPDASIEAITAKAGSLS